MLALRGLERISIHKAFEDSAYLVDTCVEEASKHLKFGLATGFSTQRIFVFERTMTVCLGLCVLQNTEIESTKPTCALAAFHRNGIIGRSLMVSGAILGVERHT